MPNTYYNKEQIKSMLKLIRPDLIYQICNDNGEILDFTSASGRELLNHLRHSVTNYDDVLKEIEEDQGPGTVTGRQVKHATNAATELVLALCRDEHIKVIQVAQQRGNVLRNLMRKAGVNSASALSSLLDSWSENLKEMAKLENSQKSLQQWNDTYRVQRELVKKILEQDNVDSQTLQKVNKIYSTRSVKKAVSMAESFLDWEKSEILRLIKSVVYYVKISQNKDDTA